MGSAGRRTLVARDVSRGTVIAERVEPADSFLARLLGLMGRPPLAAGDGLWLPGANGIHMLFMRFPIDCVFLSRPHADGRRRVVALRRSVPPWSGIVPFVRGAHGTLELPAGAIEAAGVAPGDLVELA